jgi:hypothetical protein
MSACVFCGAEGATEKVTFPSTFTAYQLLQAGDKACKRCAEMFHDPKYRRNCWIMKGDGSFWVLDKPLKALGNLPNPPFLLYLTRTKRKHGWIRSVQNPVLDKSKFILVVDEEKVLFDLPRFLRLNMAVCRMRLFGLPKKCLLGFLPPSVIRKYKVSKEEIEMINKMKGDPLWGLIVAFAD